MFSLLPESSGQFRLEMNGMTIGRYSSKQNAIDAAKSETVSGDRMTIHDSNGKIKKQIEIEPADGGGSGFMGMDL
jgi:hypothetical protein